MTSGQASTESESYTIGANDFGSPNHQNLNVGQVWDQWWYHNNGDTASSPPGVTGYREVSSGSNVSPHSPACTSSFSYPNAAGGGKATSSGRC